MAACPLPRIAMPALPVWVCLLRLTNRVAPLSHTSAGSCNGANRTVVVEVLGKMGEDEVVGIKGGLLVVLIVYCKGLGPDDVVSSCQ